MAGFLYLGAGAGMGAIALLRKFKKTGNTETKLTGKELPYIVAMILLDIAAPVCLLIGLKSTSAANASLLNNFEIVATAIVALAVFKEKISLRLWLRLWLRFRRGISRCRLGRSNRFRRFIFRAVFIVEDTFYGIFLEIMHRPAVHLWIVDTGILCAFFRLFFRLVAGKFHKAGDSAFR